MNKNVGGSTEWPDFDHHPQLLTRAGLAEAGGSFQVPDRGTEYALLPAYAAHPNHLLFRMEGNSAVPLAAARATSDPARLLRIYGLVEQTHWTHLRRALRGMRRHIQRRISQEAALPADLVRTAPLRELEEALRGNDAGEMIDAGGVAADWITAAMSPEQRTARWESNSPNWEILEYRQAAKYLGSRKPACGILEADHPSSRFDANVTHTVIQLAALDQPGVAFAAGLYLKHVGRWYVAELVRETGPGLGEVVEMRLVAGPYESELVARFEQLYEAPMSLRPARFEAADLTPGGAPPTDADHPAAEWAQRWAEQQFHAGGDSWRDATDGYLAAARGDGTNLERRGSEEWGRGWIAGCAARMLGYTGLCVSVQQQEQAPHPGVSPLWMVVDTHTGEPVPGLTNIQTANEATGLAVGYGVLETEVAPPHHPQRVTDHDPRTARIPAAVKTPLEGAGYGIADTGGGILTWMKLLDPETGDVLTINSVFGDAEGDESSPEWIIGRSRGDDWLSIENPYTLADAIRAAGDLPQPGRENGRVMEETFPDLATALEALRARASE
jgi:hypothetical protein